MLKGEVILRVKVMIKGEVVLKVKVKGKRLSYVKGNGLI